MEYRWLRNDEIENWVNPVCEARGWAVLNISDPPTCRVLGAFDGIEFVGFMALQLYPVLGPAWADTAHRKGEVSREMADKMHEFLIESNARAALTICESLVSERLAERHGMVRVHEPVFHWLGKR
jgi:hypothetical protein